MSEREAMGKLADELQDYFGREYFGPGSEDLRKRVLAALRAAAPTVTGEALARETIEQCAKIALDYPTPEGESDEYASGFIDASVFIRDAILASSPKQEKGTPV